MASARQVALAKWHVRVSPISNNPLSCQNFSDMARQLMTLAVRGLELRLNLSV